MESLWYKMQLSGSQALKDLCYEFDEIAVRYPFLKGNSVCELISESSSDVQEKTYYISLNPKISLLGLIFQDLYSALPCEKPQHLRLIRGDARTCL